MGLIAQRVAAATGEARFNRTEWLNDDDDGEGRTSAGVTVTSKSAATVSTVVRCVEILTNAVGNSPRDVVLRLGGQSYPEFRNVPGWVDLPNPATPASTGSDYIKALVQSYLYDGNYFVRVYPDIFAPQALQALDPSRVRVKPNDVGPGPILEILDERGGVVEVLLPFEYLHGKWLVESPTDLRGISRLEKMRRTLGAAIAAEDFASRFFGQGGSLSFGVEVPYLMDNARRDELRASLKAKYNGLRNSHAIGVLSDGAKFVTGLAPTPEQAQMLETRKFSVEEVAGRWYGVPPYLVGSQEPGAASYASTTTARQSFGEFTILPLVAAIEDQHNRLLTNAASVAGGRMQFKLNVNHLLRADVAARFQAYEVGIRNGMMTPNEARAKEDMNPIVGGDRLYMQAQMTPIDQLGTTSAASPARSSEEAA